MSTKLRLQSDFPEKNLSVTKLIANLDRVTLENKKDTNDYGGESLKLYFNDGKSNNRRPSLEVELYSKFGVSKFEEKKPKDGSKAKVSWSIQFPHRENPELVEMSSKWDSYICDQIYAKKELCFADTELITPAFLPKIFHGLARKPKNPVNFEKYGYSSKGNLYDSTKYYITTDEIDPKTLKKKIRPCTRDELENKEGTYTVSLVFPKIYLKPMECGAVVDVDSILYHGDDDDGGEPFSNFSLKRKHDNLEPSDNPPEPSPLPEDSTSPSVATSVPPETSEEASEPPAEESHKKVKV